MREKIKKVRPEPELALDASRAAVGERVSADSTHWQFTVEVPVVFRLGIAGRRIPRLYDCLCMRAEARLKSFD